MSRPRRAAAALLSAAFFVTPVFACAAAPARSPTPSAQDGAPKSVTLAPGESASLDGGRLSVKFVSVSEDSRCPKGEQCLWAGNARVVLEIVASGGERSAVSLDTNPSRGPAEADVAGGVLVLEGLAPLPVKGRTIAAADYRVTLSLRRS